MATEDLTTYTEVDGNGDLTVTTSKVDFTTMPANVTDYLYDDKGASHWSGDFNIDFDFELTATNGANTQCILTTISNVIGVPNSSTSLMTYLETSSLTPYLADIDSAGNWDSWAGGSNLSLNTVYYCTLSRTGDTLDWNIYSNASRTTLVQNITILITNTAQTFRYIYAMSSIDIGDGSDITGYVQNLDLNEAVNYDRTLSDSANASDQQQAYEEKIRLLTSGLGISDNIVRVIQSVGLSIERVLLSKASVSDSTISFKFLYRLLNVPVNVNETLKRNSILDRIVTSDLSTYDLINSSKEVFRLIGSGLSVEDAVQRIIATIYEVILSSNVEIVDSLNTQKQIRRLLMSSISILDDVLKDKNLLRLLSSNVDLVDFVARLITGAPQTYNRVLSDSTELQDLILKEITGQLIQLIIFKLSTIYNIEQNISSNEVIVDTVTKNIETDTGDL